MHTDALPRHRCAYFVYTLAFVVSTLLGLSGLHATDAVAANLLLAEPVHGSFTTAAEIVTSGRVEADHLSDVVLTVNGTVVTPAADGSFSHPVALAAERIFNPVLVELTAAGHTTVQRPVVIVGTPLPDTALAPESLAVRLTDRGIDQLESLVSRLVDVDVASFLPPGPVFRDEVCTKIPPFGTRVCGDVHVTIEADPAPRLGALAVALDAQQDQVVLALALHNIFVRAKVDAKAGPVSASCTIDVNADALWVHSAIHLEPNAANPATVDVMQLGDALITFGNFADHTDCGGLLGDIIEELAKALVGDIQDLLQAGLGDFLNAVDAAGNTLLAGILEEVLGALSLEAAINTSIAATGLQAQVPFARISEDDEGITFVVDTSVGALPGAPCATSQDSPPLAAVYDVPQPLPVLGAATPGGLPFDAGGTVSATVLNQALRGATACGLLQAAFAEIDIDGNPVPITAGLLGVFLPAFNQLDPAQPIHVVLRPTLAPVISGTPGPLGELLDLRVSTYLVELLTPGDTSPLMQLALDLRAGLDMQLDPATGAVQPRIGNIADWSAILLANPLGVDPSRIHFFIELLLPEIDGLNDDLEPFDIPAIPGFDLAIVEVSRINPHLGAFLHMMAQP